MNNLIQKIKKLFNKNTTPKEDFSANAITDTTFDEKLKVEIQNDYSKKLKRDAFLKEIEENPDLLYSLSEERLQIISDYYDEIIDELKKELEKEKIKLEKNSSSN